MWGTCVHVCVRVCVSNVNIGEQSIVRFDLHLHIESAGATRARALARSTHIGQSSRAAGAITRFDKVRIAIFALRHARHASMRAKHHKWKCVCARFENTLEHL